jgi:hypothetical protein
VALGLVLSGGIAAAETIKYPTHFKSFKFEASSSGGTFKGKLSSLKDKCIKGRKVKLVRKHNGNKTKLGSDKSNDQGKWKIDLSGGKVKNGQYYANVKKKTFDDGQKVCLSVTSGTIKIF